MLFHFLLLSSLFLNSHSHFAYAQETIKAATDSPDQDHDQARSIQKFMAELRGANKKSKWSETIYPDSGWRMHTTSVEGRPLIYFVCGERNQNTTLMFSAVHGDEVTPIYFGMRLVSWVKGEPDLCRDYRIVIAPLINPDGYLNKSGATRFNHNGVDLNRNFPTKDFNENAVKLWKAEAKSDKRRFPGSTGGSEPETKFQMWLIDEFKPSKILSVHSPLNFFDYDGPQSEDVKNLTEEYIRSCDQLRTVIKKSSPDYNFLRYGFFPGSLGNYAGKEKSIPTLTLELPTTDAKKAKTYFERLKQGTRRLVMYKVTGRDAVVTKK
jgi:protein MpaA